MQNRGPRIDNTCRELGWKPKVNMKRALKNIFDAYRTHVAQARRLMDLTTFRPDQTPGSSCTGIPQIFL